MSSIREEREKEGAEGKGREVWYIGGERRRNRRVEKWKGEIYSGREGGREKTRR